MIRKIFTVNNLLLLAAIYMLIWTIIEFPKAYGKLPVLLKHTGVVSEKKLTSVSDTQSEVRGDSLRTVTIRLMNDNTEYTISFRALYVNTLVNTGDSVDLYTRAVKSDQENIVITGSGGSVRSNNPAEIVQIISKEYEKPVIAYKDYMSAIKTNVWAIPMLSVAFFLLYFIQRARMRGFFSFDVGGKEVTIG